MVKLFGKTWVQLLVLAAAVALSYANTLDVPFYFDDYRAIAEDADIHDPTDLGRIWSSAPARAFGQWTLALNYGAHGTRVAGYHLVNALIHFLAGCAVLALLGALVRSPAVTGEGRDWLLWVPLLAALLFVLHPLQTQAVTYIVQRVASLAGALYLAALACYAWARLRHWRWLFGGVLLFGGLALLTKQNAATLPAAILLVELIFFRRLSTPQRWSVLVVAGLTAAALVYLVNREPFDSMTRGAWKEEGISRSAYFATQSQVLWRYAALFFYPADQRLEYDIPLQPGLGEPLVGLALAAHVLLIVLAFALWPRAPLVTFGVLFWYLAHLVESSFLPISDLAVEHRTYLPNLGPATITAFLLAWLGSFRRLRYPAVAASLLVVLGAAWLTVQRNALWRDPVAFHKRDTELSPNKERAWTSYGKELMRRERFPEALAAFGQALNLGRTEDGHLEVQPQTLLNAVLAMYYTGQHRKAVQMEQWLPLEELAPVERSTLHAAKGLALLSLKRPGLAREEFESALQFYPNINAQAGIATVHYLDGEYQRARQMATEVLRQDPQNRLARQVVEKTDALR